MLKDFISSFMISRCIVWCLLLSCMFFGFFLGEYGYISLYEPQYLCFEVL